MNNCQCSIEDRKSYGVVEHTWGNVCSRCGQRVTPGVLPGSKTGDSTQAMDRGVSVPPDQGTSASSPLDKTKVSLGIVAGGILFAVIGAGILIANSSRNETYFEAQACQLATLNEVLGTNLDSPYLPECEEQSNALPIALLIGGAVAVGTGLAFGALQKRGETKKTCPACAEKILLEAKVCKHCGHSLGELSVSEHDS